MRHTSQPLPGSVFRPSAYLLVHCMVSEPGRASQRAKVPATRAVRLSSARRALSIPEAARRSASRLPVAAGYGTRASWCCDANSRSSSVSSESRTGVTSVQCFPTGQYWNLLIPRRMAFSEAPGIQRVVNRWPCPAADDGVSTDAGISHPPRGEGNGAKGERDHRDDNYCGHDFGIAIPVLCGQGHSSCGQDAHDRAAPGRRTGA